MYVHIQPPYVIIHVIVVTHVGVMYLIMRPWAEVDTNQIHHIPTRVATNLYSY